MGARDFNETGASSCQFVDNFGQEKDSIIDNLYTYRKFVRSKGEGRDLKTEERQGGENCI